MARLPKITFGVALLLFQIMLLSLYAKYVYYPDPPKNGTSTNNGTSTEDEITTHLQFYSQFQDVHVMIFIGFGFLMTFLKKYGFGAVSYNMLIAAVVVQWAILLNQWVRQRVMKEEGHLDDEDANRIVVSVKELMTADFTAAAVLITFGAVLGKASRLQLLVMAIFECIFFAINETVIFEFLHITDVGGSIVVHLFGAYFGLAVSIMLQNNGDEHENEASVYHSDIFAMIGTLFLWIFWPSFNAGPLGDNPIAQNRAVVNTYLSLAACVATTFVASSMVDKRFKLNMVHIQNATLAGGVAVGTSADMMLRPWGAILIGMIAGILSVVGYTYITPFLYKKLRIHDTCGVHNLHGMPAILAAICAAIASAAIPPGDYTSPSDFKNLFPKVDDGSRSRSEQGGFQIAAALVALAISIFGGLITGFVLSFIGTVDNVEYEYLYNDDNEFEVPDEIISIKQLPSISNGETKPQFHMSEASA